MGQTQRTVSFRTGCENLHMRGCLNAAPIEAVPEAGHLVSMLDTRTNARKKLVTRKFTLAIGMLLVMCADVIRSLMGRATWVLLTQLSNVPLPRLTRRT